MSQCGCMDCREITYCHSSRIEWLESENARLREALELIAMPKRPDGTYNRSREACEQLAREVLEGKE